MEVIADLHIHSKYSRATSKQLDIANLEKWARIKGINLLGTGDFTHPIWIKELKECLQEDGTGILKTKTGMPFMLQTEISLIYTDLGKGRRVHLVILAPDFSVVDQISEYFGKRGRLDYDGRPIFKIPCNEVAESLTNISKDIEIIPAHIWTPWFSLFGSMSGFDSIKDCFKDQVKHIHALETGLSSDPPMNWRLSTLDKFSLVSSSDAHSFWPWRIGREATIFDIPQLTYRNLINALRSGNGLHSTIEVDPTYGKYHFDGHRNCAVCMSPQQSKDHNKLCPKCGKLMTIGVDHRVEELADRDLGFTPPNAKPYVHLIPLSEIISKICGVAVSSKKVWAVFNALIKEFHNELAVLQKVPLADLGKVVDEKCAEAIIQNRAGQIKVKPGYDGEYGIPLLGSAQQKGLLEFT